MDSVLEQLLLQVQNLQEKQDTQQRCISISAENSRKILRDHSQLKLQMHQMQQQMQMLQMQMDHLQGQADFLSQMQRDLVDQMQFFKDFLTAMCKQMQQLRRQATVAAGYAVPESTSSSGTQIACKTSKTRRAGNIGRSNSSMDETAGQQNVDRRPSTIDSPIDPTGQRVQTLELASLVIPRPPGVEESAPVLSDAGAPPPVESPTAPLVKADEAEWKKRLPADMLHLSVRLSELERRFETLLLVSIVADDTGTWQ